MCCWSVGIQSHMPDKGGSQASCTLSWAVALVSRAFGSWKCLEVKQSAEKPEPGSSQGPTLTISLVVAGPASQHCCLGLSNP